MIRLNYTAHLYIVQCQFKMQTKSIYLIYGVTQSFSIIFREILGGEEENGRHRAGVVLSPSSLYLLVLTPTAYLSRCQDKSFQSLLTFSLTNWELR